MGMKKLCIGVVAVVSIVCGPALAADMPAKAPVYKAAAPVSFAWTGCYVGGNVGGGWARTSYRINDPRTAPFDGTDLGSNTGSGVVGGGHICWRQVGPGSLNTTILTWEPTGRRSSETQISRFFWSMCVVMSMPSGSA